MRLKEIQFLLLSLACLVALHQFVNWGYWWEWKDFLHHEVAVGLLVATSFGMWYVGRKRQE